MVNNWLREWRDDLCLESKQSPRLVWPRHAQYTYSSLLSQVATLDYVRNKTSVPVPNVFYYDSSPYNEIGYEYIVMSKVRPSEPYYLVIP